MTSSPYSSTYLEIARQSPGRPQLAGGSAAAPPLGPVAQARAVNRPGGSGDWPRARPSGGARSLRSGGGARRRVWSPAVRSSRPPARPPAGPSSPCLPGRAARAMESYDIIANQPVVIDNVRPCSSGGVGRGEAGAPPPGRTRRREGPRPSRLVLCALPVGGRALPEPEPCPSRVMSTWGGHPSPWPSAAPRGREGCFAPLHSDGPLGALGPGT